MPLGHTRTGKGQIPLKRLISARALSKPKWGIVVGFCLTVFGLSGFFQHFLGCWATVDCHTLDACEETNDFNRH